MPGKKLIWFQPKPPASNSTLGRTFEISLHSDAVGYTADVVEILEGGARRPVTVQFGPRIEIDASSFFRMRLHYRGTFIADIMQWIERGPVSVPVLEAPLPMFLRANLTGWPDGHPLPIDDDLSDWE